MSARRVWIVGAGKRVRETALPALLSMPESFEVAGVLARTSRDMEAAGRRFPVRALGDLRPQDLARGDLVYVAVGKDAVPEVLGHLKRFDRAHLELLIDTPVLRFKHLRHRSLLEGWDRAGVAEDTIHLPWYETARAAAGEIASVVFDRSAYAYHALAQAKALCGARAVTRARRVRMDGGRSRRELELARDGSGSIARATILEPRDYSLGRFVVVGARGLVTDRLETPEEGTHLAPILENGVCVGFRAGDAATRLSPDEIDLARTDSPGASVTARMESMKRIGFRRILAGVATGRGAYPPEEGLDDMAIDWFLERFGRWRAAPLLDVHSGVGRALWSAVGRLK
ncbi:MAG: hypothetical protein ACKVXR_00320 [Planctomycetota bacterium]